MIYRCQLPAISLGMSRTRYRLAVDSVPIPKAISEAYKLTQYMGIVSSAALPGRILADLGASELQLV